MITSLQHRVVSQKSAVPQPSSVAIALTTSDLQELSEHAQRQGEVLHRQVAFETQSNLPSVLGKGGDRIIPLRNGLTLYIRNATLWQPLHLEQCYDSDFPLTATFYLSGSSRVKTKSVVDLEPEYAEIAGCNYLCYLPNLTEVEEWPPNEVIHGVMLRAPIDCLRSFYVDENLIQPLQRLLEGDRSQRFHQPLGQTTAAMNQALQQILHAPYQGITQQLYLESKALELLAFQFSQCSGARVVERRSRQFSSDELERLHAAKALLTRSIDDAPALRAIAQEVGLSEYRLKQGFHQVFGTTPFGYLHHYRMQVAQELLLSSNLSIAGVAAKVGYCNPEAFSTAFRRKFGISPKAHQLGKHL